MTAAEAGAAAKRGHLRDLGLPAMFGAVVLLVSATLLLGANISALRGNLKWLDQSQQVLNQIADLESGMLGQELTVRGYALTGDPSFLHMQQFGTRRRANTIATLKHLMGAEPTRQAQFRQVMQAVEQHTAIFDNLSGIGPDRAGIVARAIVDPAVRANMRVTRDGLAALRAAELRDLANRQRDITNQLGRAFFLAVGIIVTAFLLGGIGLWAAQLTPHKH